MAYKVIWDEIAFETLVWQLKLVYLSLILWMVLVVVIGSLYGTCEDGPPTILFQIFSIYLFAAASWQLWRVGGGSETVFDMMKLMFYLVVGLQEIADFQSDAYQLASAYMCDENFQENFVHSFDDSYIVFLKPIVAVLHIYGLMTLFLVLSSMGVWAMSQLMDKTNANVKTKCSFWCCIVGMGAINGTIDDDGARTSGSLSRIVSVVAGEVVPQSLLGASLFGLSFAATNDTAKFKQLLALSLTAMSLIKVGFEGLSITWHNWRTFFSNVPALFLIPSLASVSLASIGAVLIMGLRVHFAYECPSHILNLGKGCANITSVG